MSKDKSKLLYFFYALFLAIPSTILTLITTNTTITTTWTPPLFAPSAYLGYRQCRRLCEQALGLRIPSAPISSPYIFTGIDPGSYCIVDLNGQYGTDQPLLATTNATTLSSGKVYTFSHSQILLCSHIPIYSTCFICQ